MPYLGKCTPLFWRSFILCISFLSISFQCICLYQGICRSCIFVYMASFGPGDLYTYIQFLPWVPFYWLVTYMWHPSSMVTEACNEYKVGILRNEAIMLHKTVIKPVHFSCFEAYVKEFRFAVKLVALEGAAQGHRTYFA